MKINWVKYLIGGFSFTTALFIFQACYGTMQDFGMDVHVSGKVVSKQNGLPLSGIKVSAPHTLQYQITNSEGLFDMYIHRSESMQLQFLDIDSTLNGAYQTRDTVIELQNDSISLFIEMEPLN